MLYRETLASLWDWIELSEEIDEEHRVGVGVFDGLTVGPKLAMLVQVSEALLDETVPMPELTAVNEATVAAIFAQLWINIDLEIDNPDTTTNWRTLILEACLEVGMEELPEVECDDLEEWDLWIDSLENRILWDADYENDRILDDPPEVRQGMLSLMRIPDGYYTAVAPDLRSAEIADFKKQLQKLIHG